MKIVIYILKVTGYILTILGISLLLMGVLGILMKEGFEGVVLRVLSPFGLAVNHLSVGAVIVPGLILHGTGVFLARKHNIVAETSESVREFIAVCLIFYMVTITIWTTIHAFQTMGFLAALISFFFFLISPIYWIYHNFVETGSFFTTYNIVCFVFYPLLFTFYVFINNQCSNKTYNKD